MSDDRTKAMMEWIFPPDSTPQPCPRCGGSTVLVVERSVSWLECRRWFGLRLCTKGPFVLEGRDDGDYARRAATQAWNRWCARGRR